MAYIRCDFKSLVLDMRTSMIVFLPDEKKVSEAPVVYLLHGLSDNSTAWSRWSNVERYAIEHGVTVVMPEVQRSFYTDMSLGLDYFKFVSVELREICHHFFNTPTAANKSYVMGLSMGGYGALKCALTYPKKFAGCAAFSPACDIESLMIDNVKMNKKEMKAIFGEKLQSKDSIFSLVKKVKNAPFIYLACGEEDFIFSHSEKLNAALEEKDLDYKYEHWSGIHDWAFWDEAVKRAFNLYF
ncbi:MAG: alpha/beta hydrolase family protein [Spirochaetales bacterium]|nr:alpha/beta hydrolase family protein [Spirochaetales bacterium]